MKYLTAVDFIISTASVLVVSAVPANPNSFTDEDVSLAGAVMPAAFCVQNKSPSYRLFRSTSVECTLPSELRSWCPSGTFRDVHRLSIGLTSSAHLDAVELELTCFTFRFPDLREISIDPRVDCLNLDQIDGRIRVVSGCGVDEMDSAASTTRRRVVELSDYDVWLSSEKEDSVAEVVQTGSIQGE